MPVKIPRDLPARELLESENIFVMTDDRAASQDIRPLKIAILNLMPTKIQTETQLLRLLGNTPLQVEITLLHMDSHESKNTSPEHLDSFYSTWDQVCHRKFDGLLITGAPVENLDFPEVDYWPEMRDILEWSKHNVYSTLHICWGAQAGLYHHYGIQKFPLDQKQFGIYEHVILDSNAPIVRGFDEIFPAPHSRHTANMREDIIHTPDLHLIAESEEAGVFLIASRDGRRIFVTGHPEYDRLTLQSEYERDVKKGLPIGIPRHYFPSDDPSKPPLVSWRSHANLLYSNWLNYYVYQATPFHLDAIEQVVPSADDFSI